jgi:hypothetical protein
VTFLFEKAQAPRLFAMDRSGERIVGHRRGAAPELTEILKKLRAAGLTCTARRRGVD